MDVNWVGREGGQHASTTFPKQSTKDSKRCSNGAVGYSGVV